VKPLPIVLSGLIGIAAGFFAGRSSAPSVPSSPAAVEARADSDFPATLKYAIAVEDTGTRGQILQSLSHNPNANRKELLSAVMEHVPPAERKNAGRAVANGWSQTSPEAALTWVKGISDEKDRLHQTENIARDWIRQDPTTARGWISTSNLPEDIRKRLLK